MKQYDHIIIGFGKGGKTLAASLAGMGDSVALIEASHKMYGGTCINVGCIPSKSLENNSRLSKALCENFDQKAERYAKAVKEKQKLTAMLREKNYDKVSSAGVDIFNGRASFKDSHTVYVNDSGKTLKELSGENIYINTGSRPFIPNIPGLKESSRVYTSETLMDLEKLPQELVIIGGGYIGLEFASYYANFGSRITVIQDGDKFIPREDNKIAQSVSESFKQRGIRILNSTQILSIKDDVQRTMLEIKNPDGKDSLTADAVLIATGRIPNISELNVQLAGIELTDRGAIAVDETLHTSAPHIWAMGDVKGGLQFTYISLDDSRIIASQLKGDRSRTTENRGNIPYTVFLDPPLSRVGLTEQQALDNGYKILIASLPASAVPKAHVIKQSTGVLKIIIDSDTNLILGAHLFCAQSHEIINIIKLAMDTKLPYTVLRDGIYTHPTMSEAFNDLLANVNK